MKILVISDMHSNKVGLLNKIILETKPNYIFFLGDGLKFFQEQLNNFDLKKVYMVRGNCDFFSKAPETQVIEVEGFKFLLTHGHKFGVKSSINTLFYYAKEQNIDVVCFGHTHRSFSKTIDNINFLNPGSLSSERASENSFAVLEIIQQKIRKKIEKI